MQKAQGSGAAAAASSAGSRQAKQALCYRPPNRGCLFAAIPGLGRHRKAIVVPLCIRLPAATTAKNKLQVPVVIAAG
jgi:hypothetical protein